MKKKTKQSPYGAKRSRFTAVFCSNVSIIWACIVLIFQIISIGTTMWYVSQDDIIKYVHGGLWNICMGEINRTFCSYRSYTPGWLKASQTFFLLSTGVLFLEIIYIVITAARKTLRMSVVAGLSNITGLLYLIALIVYSTSAFSRTVQPSNSFVLACITMILHLVASILNFYTFTKTTKLNKKQIVENGIMP